MLLIRVIVSCFFASACLCMMDRCNAQPATPIVYISTVDGFQNRFLIGPKEATSGARYKLKAGLPVQFDRLTYVRDVEFPDGRSNAPEIVRGWMYEGSDKSENTWRIIFGKEQNTIPGTFPIYYSFKKDGEFERWLIDGGTRREDANLVDEVQSILWANQVDIDRLGLEPFDPGKQSPIAVSLAWSSIKGDLNRMLGKTGSSLTNNMVKLPNGKVQMDLNVSGPDRETLFESLRFRHDLDVQIQWEKTTRAVAITEISQQFFTSGNVDYGKVADNISSLVKIDSPELARLGLRTTKAFLTNKCIVSTTPWQEFNCDANYCQFWKMRFGFEKVIRDQKESYELSVVYDIGECRTEEKNLGETFVIHKYQSLDGDDFSSFSASMPREGQGVIYATREIARPSSMPAGHSIYDPMESFNLKDMFNSTFNSYVSRIQGN
jgi:hypothetical protein